MEKIKQYVYTNVNRMFMRPKMRDEARPGGSIYSGSGGGGALDRPPVVGGNKGIDYFSISDRGERECVARHITEIRLELSRSV